MERVDVDGNLARAIILNSPILFPDTTFTIQLKWFT